MSLSNFITFNKFAMNIGEPIKKSLQDFQLLKFVVSFYLLFIR